MAKKLKKKSAKKKDISNIPIEDIILDDVLTSPARRIVFNGLMLGMKLKDAAKEADLAYSGVRSWATKNNVQALVKREQQKIARKVAARFEIDEAKVLREIALLAFSNMADFVETDEDGNFRFKDWSQLSREQLAAVESIKITTTTSQNKDGTKEFVQRHTQFKLYSKTANLEQLCKHLGLFALDNNQKRPIIAVQFNLSTENE